MRSAASPWRRSLAHTWPMHSANVNRIPARDVADTKHASEKRITIRYSAHQLTDSPVVRIASCGA